MHCFPEIKVKVSWKEIELCWIWLPGKEEIAKIAVMKEWIDIKRPPWSGTGVKERRFAQPCKGGTSVL